MKPELKRTHGKNGLPPLAAYVDRSTHISVNTFVMVDDDFHFLGFACQMSDADTRDN